MPFPENKLMIMRGDVPAGMYTLTDSSLSGSSTIIMLSEIRACDIVSDRHETYHTGLGRIAGGILGAALLGPIGAAGGLLAGGKKRIDETIVLCNLYNGKSFAGDCSQLTAARLSQIVAVNQSSKNSVFSASLSQSTFEAPPNYSGDLGAIECPMCAERIKAKAKICRFCGYKVQEERDKQLRELESQDDVKEIIQFDHLYLDYVERSESDEIIDRETALEVMCLFSRFQKVSPELTHREWAGMVRDELGIDS